MSFQQHEADSPLSIVGDINIVASQLIHTLGEWSYDTNSLYMNAIFESKIKNEKKFSIAAKLDTVPITYFKVFDVIKETLHKFIASRKRWHRLHILRC